MIKKLLFNVIFTVVFVPAHSKLTILCWAEWRHNVVGAFCAKVLSLPLFLPMIMLDPDAARFPKWHPVASVLANSLIWAILILLLIACVRRWWRKGKQQDA